MEVEWGETGKRKNPSDKCLRDGGKQEEEVEKRRGRADSLFNVNHWQGQRGDTV